MPPHRSYDDITRTTVPLPDSSHRPTRGEETAAERPPGPRIEKRFDDVTSPSVDAIQAALAALQGADLADLDLTLEESRVEISGSVADESDRDRIVRAISDVPGVVAVIDTLRIRSH